MKLENKIEMSVIIPCLNEEKTLKQVINKTKNCLETNNITYEIIIADNGSIDDSIYIANQCNVRVIHEECLGYGSALKSGIRKAEGKYCIMGDADDSYDFSTLMPFINKLRDGYDLVVGNRFKGGIEKGAMPFLHKLGTPVISLIGNLIYNTGVNDFNCGLRAFDKNKILDLNLKSNGMEYASEMIIESAKNNYKITEVPTKLFVDGRDRKPYLNTWKDGYKHLKLIITHRERD